MDNKISRLKQKKSGSIPIFLMQLFQSVTKAVKNNM